MFHFLQDPVDLPAAKLIIADLRRKHRIQSEQIMAWNKAFNLQTQQQYRENRIKNDQLNTLTSQLLLLESRLKRKQKHISTLLGQRELTILRQQKLIDALSSRLVDHGLDACDPTYFGGVGYADFDSLNDSDSAVVLEEIDSDCNSSLVIRRKSGAGDVTIVRSISDAIETNLKYAGNRRSNCYLRRPDILETVYSVEEDPEPDVAEKRDKFKNRSEKVMLDCIDDSDKELVVPNFETHQQLKSISEDRSPDRSGRYSNGGSSTPIGNTNAGGSCSAGKLTQVTNYNRVMTNHRSVTKPKDVKYKRINKAKSKSLEELRGRLKHWVEKGNGSNSGGSVESTDSQKRAHSYA